ncbi:hypothetical protein GY45DRAFT_1335313 [Cubamyces sp. BRFM 1775]|nr:hypothetical protein GY45DRAFT_1335313 [Cubamyces sp. BRFM 1775]
MAPKSQKSKSINKADPRRPYIILRTLPSFSFSTPSQSVGVHLSLHVSPTPQDKLRLMAVPLVPSARMFGENQLIGSPTPSKIGRALAARAARSSSSDSSTSSTKDRIKSLENTVIDLERELTATKRELEELKASVDKRMSTVESTMKKMESMLEKVTQMAASQERSLDASAPPVPAQPDIPSDPPSPPSPTASHASPTISISSPAPASPASPTPTPMTLTADAATPPLHETASAVDLPRASDSRGGVLVSRVRRIASRIYRTPRALHRGAGRSAAVKAKGGREEKTKAAPSTPQVL